MSSNPQYFQTRINANKMPAEVSRFREANLPPRSAGQTKNSKQKVQEITRQTTGRRGKSRRPDDQTANRQSQSLTILSPWLPQNIRRNLPRRSMVVLPCPTAMDATSGPFRSTPRECGLFPSEAHAGGRRRGSHACAEAGFGPGVSVPRPTTGEGGGNARAACTGAVVHAALTLCHGPLAVPDDARAAVRNSPSE